MARRIIPWLIVLSLIAAPGVYLYLHEPPLEVTVTSIERGPVETTIAAISSGTVKAASDSMIAGGVLGIIVSLHAAEGQHVAKDDLLVELAHEDLDAHVALAEANLEAGKATLEKAKLAQDIYAEIASTRVRLAQEQVRSARQDHERVLGLSEKGGLSQSELDKVALALSVAQDNLAQAEASQRENLVRGEEVRAAEANTHQLGAALTVANTARNKAFVRAPFEGVVARRFVDIGESVSMGVPLVQLIQTGEISIEAPFDEANVADMRVGQKARINLDAYRGEDFYGEVTYIAPTISINPDLSRTLNVKIRVTQGIERFIAGMSADVTLIVEEKDDVVFAPSEALVRESFAYVAIGNRAMRRDVKLGAGNWERREVLEGLSAGDQLITSVSLKQLTNGVKITIASE